MSRGRAAAELCPRHHRGRGSWEVRAVVMCCCFEDTSPSPWQPSNGNCESWAGGKLWCTWNRGGVTRVTGVLQWVAANPSEGTGEEQRQ